MCQILPSRLVPTKNKVPIPKEVTRTSSLQLMSG